MILARILYHEEPDGWWAESAEFPSFFAAGDSFDETKLRVREALPRVAGDQTYLGMIHLIFRGTDPDVDHAEYGIQGKDRGSGMAEPAQVRFVLTE